MRHFREPSRPKDEPHGPRMTSTGPRWASKVPGEHARLQGEPTRPQDEPPWPQNEPPISIIFAKLLPLSNSTRNIKKHSKYTKFRGYEISYTPYALMVCKVFQKLSLSYIIINFLFASLILLTNFENAYWNPPQNSLLCDWSMFSSADLSLAAGKMRENLMSPAAFGIILQNHRRLHSPL
jgi:hypothetical protein